MTSAPSRFDPKNSVLFLGSGFSAGARNVGKEELPAGNPLKALLGKLLEVNAADYDLMTLAQEFTGDDGDRLYNLLYETFTVAKPLADQIAILKHPWRRIYTTNYDDLIEWVDPGLACFNYDDIKPRSLPSRMTVHLHGIISRATPNNVLSQLILNETSYVDQISSPSTWLDEFARDLRFSDACYFVGYNLADHHITAMMRRSEEARSKTFFVTRGEPTRIFANRVAEYGSILPIGREGFEAFCRTTAPPDPIISLTDLKSVKLISPFSDRKAAEPTTPVEVRNLIVYGRFVLNRFIASFGHGGYVIPRKKAVGAGSNMLKTAKVLLINSRLGNGKTIFLYALAQAMSEQGFKSFQWLGQATGLERELELLAKSGRIFVFFDDYDAAIENLPRLAVALPEARFAVASRTSRTNR